MTGWMRWKKEGGGRREEEGRSEVECDDVEVQMARRRKLEIGRRDNHVAVENNANRAGTGNKDASKTFTRAIRALQSEC